MLAVLQANVDVLRKKCGDLRSQCEELQGTAKGNEQSRAQSRAQLLVQYQEVVRQLDVRCVRRGLGFCVNGQACMCPSVLYRRVRGVCNNNKNSIIVSTLVGQHAHGLYARIH